MAIIIIQNKCINVLVKYETIHSNYFNYTVSGPNFNLKNFPTPGQKFEIWTEGPVQISAGKQ